jgi:hypothetical protein
MNWKFASTPKMWVMPIAGSPISRSGSPGSNARVMITVPPA